MRRYPLKFAQAQLILNAFYLLEFVPFVRTGKPEAVLPPVELEALRERVRSAKATVLPPGIPCTGDEYDVAKRREVVVGLTPPDLNAVLVALSASLAGGTITISSENVGGDGAGGTITASSDGAGAGSVFTVEFMTAHAPPAGAAGAAAADSPETTEDSASASSAAAKTARILLVEDHVDSARALGKLLSGAGYAVKTAHTVAAALHLADDEQFDLLISDLGLPDASGYELMETIRARHGGGIKGIALSGYGMEEDLKRSRDAGFCDHVVKPVNVAQLETVIRQLLDGS